MNRGYIVRLGEFRSRILEFWGADGAGAEGQEYAYHVIN